MTGYGAEAIDGRFASYRVLQKPIQRQALQNAFVVRRVFVDFKASSTLDFGQLKAGRLNFEI
jgi:hypothetical protein